MQDFTRLKVWQRAHGLTLALYKSTRPFPKDEQYGLTSQIRRAGTSVPTNIAEGCGSNSNADFAWFLQMAMRSASEVQYQLILARDLGYLNAPDYAQLTDDVVAVKRMLSSLISKVNPRQRQPMPQDDNRKLITDNR